MFQSIGSRQSYLSLRANSTKFDFSGSNQPSVVAFYQWITGVNYNVTSSNNYWSDMALYTHSLSQYYNYEIELYFYVGGSFYIKGLKAVIFIAGNTVGNDTTAFYRARSSAGIYSYYNFEVNFGVPLNFFGHPSTGRSCFSGINSLDLYVYNNNHYPMDASFTL